jgi:hypothetical protein
MRALDAHRYNSLFCFLLRTTRVQLGLQKAWTEQMWKLKKRRKADTTATYTRLSSLRAKMAFLVDNLQYFLHVDVSRAVVPPSRPSLVPGAYLTPRGGGCDRLLPGT